MESFWVLGDRYTFLHTSPALSVLITESTMDHGAPPHIHRNEDETFYILEGEVEVHLNGQTHLLKKDDFLFLPRNLPHAFTVLSDTARLLITITPGGFEQMFRHIGTPTAHHPTDPAPLDVSIQKLLATAPTFHLELLPPVQP